MDGNTASPAGLEPADASGAGNHQWRPEFGAVCRAKDAICAGISALEGSNKQEAQEARAHLFRALRHLEEGQGDPEEG